MTAAHDWEHVEAVEVTTDPFRRRLLDGLAASVRERGYGATTVADIVRHARTSKRTFYHQFASKEECFIELLWTGIVEMIDKVRESVDPEAHWQEQIRQAIDAWVDDIESRPAITLSWIRELPALGETSRGMQRRGMLALTDMLMALSSSPGFEREGIEPMSRQMAVLLFGGLRELSALAVEDGTDVRGIVDTAVAASVAILGAGRTT